MININYPFKREEIRKLKVGDNVLITGKLFTGRDAVHKYLHEGNPSPVSLQNQIIYHCGPVVMEKKRVVTKGSKKTSLEIYYQVTAAGPTTSIREEPYQAGIIQKHGLLGMIGKGGMGAKTLAACKEFGAVYFHAIGGAAQVLASKIERVLNVYLKDKFGPPEAIWELEVIDFPVVVTMDSHGRSLHQEIEEKSAAIFQQVK